MFLLVIVDSRIMFIYIFVNSLIDNFDLKKLNDFKDNPNRRFA